MANKNFGIIYKATNKVNGKVYIGQTVQGLDKRRNDHIYDAYNKNSDFSAFHRAIIKYGQKNFSWCVLDFCGSKDKLNEKESYCIKIFKSHVKYNKGYNITVGGSGTAGVIRSEEFKLKVSISKKGKKLNLSSAERKRRSDVMKGKNNICFRVFGKKHNAIKKYVITAPVGNEFVIEGLRDFCRGYNEHNENKLYHSCLVNCANGKHNHHKGYKCRHYNEKTDCNLPMWEG
jgi:group I intron endonuclease